MNSIIIIKIIKICSEKGENHEKHILGILTKNPVIGVLAGALITAVLQSSSATIAVLQNFAMQPAADGISSILGLENAIPILLGDNIGTTITTLLACVGQSKNARRTAAAHSVFNISGSLLCVWIVPWSARVVRFFSPRGSEIEVISRQIANAHTIFNVCNTLLWLPFIWLMVKIVMFLVPGGEENENGKVLQFLDVNMLNQPVAALQLVGKEIHKEVVDYMSSLFSQGVLTEEQSIQAAGLMSVISDVERMGLRSMEMAEAAQIKMEKGYRFSKEAMKEIRDGFEQVRSMVAHVISSIQSGDKGLAKQVQLLLVIENPPSPSFASPQSTPFSPILFLSCMGIYVKIKWL